MRWWGGNQWSDRFMDAPGESTPSHPGTPPPNPPKKRGQWGPAPWWAWLLGGFFALVILGALFGEDESSNSGGDGSEATTEAVAAEQQATEPASQAGATEDDIREALDDADPSEFLAVNSEIKIKELELTGRRFLFLTLETPEGGFDGASPEDLDGTAAAAFKAIYDEADWTGGAVVAFTGGLVDTRTGNDLSDARTGLYRIDRSEARQIDWENADAIDWSLYRLFVHPAIGE